MSDKPERPYKNFEDYRLKQCRMLPESKRHDTTFFPCPKCEGYGVYYKPEDRDVYEGYKCAPRYACEKCDKSGRGSRDEHRAIYRLAIAEHQNRLRIWLERNKIRAAALNKLTSEERKVLGL